MEAKCHHDFEIYHFNLQVVTVLPFHKNSFSKIKNLTTLSVILEKQAEDTLQYLYAGLDENEKTLFFYCNFSRYLQAYLCRSAL